MMCRPVRVAGSAVRVGGVFRPAGDDEAPRAPDGSPAAVGAAAGEVALHAAVINARATSRPAAVRRWRPGRTHPRPGEGAELVAGRGVSGEYMAIGVPYGICRVSSLRGLHLA